MSSVILRGRRGSNYLSSHGYDFGANGKSLVRLTLVLVVVRLIFYGYDIWICT